MQYTVKRGFHHLFEAELHHPRSSLWNQTWHTDGMKKINFFGWLLAHKKILTAENLQKPGINGPSWCVLCPNAKESINHLFLDCTYTKEVWRLVVGTLWQRLSWPISIADFFTRWGSHYLGNFSNKPTFRRFWVSSPKYICWNVWLA